MPPSPHSLDDPDLTPFLPLIYVAWADGILSREELDHIAERAPDICALEGDARTALRSWMDPLRPPTPVDLAHLRDRIRSVAESATGEERRSLAALGVALARRTGTGDERWSTQEGLQTLEAVEELLGVLGGEAAEALLAPEAAAEAPPPPIPAEASFDVTRMRRYLDGAHGDLRREIMDLLRDPRFRPLEGSGGIASSDPDRTPHGWYRERTLEGVVALAERGYGMRALPESVGGSGDIDGSIAVFETLAHGDLSLLVKFGVQFGLFGGSVMQLGTETHHRRWLGKIGSMDLPGCYAMTEVDHGSNVRELETRARYLPEEDAFEIHTPHPGARKDWIGNAALHGRMATVFAQLDVGDEEHGVHAFLVPIRDMEGTVLPGVAIEDCGPKVGLNGVDNGRIAFQHFRIPRDHLLDRFGRVTPEGRYESPINSPGRRFFTMLGTLVTGRISIAAASLSTARTALAIAVPYSTRRRQFGPPGAAEVPILDYLMQQRLLLPRLAATYALHFAVRDLVRAHVEADGEEDRARVEVRAAGLKAYASRHALETIQAAREACGGQGYLAANRFGELREDTDVFTTFEGANVVLLQLAARGLLTRYREEVGELNLRGLVRLLADRAGSQLTLRNPIRSRRTGEDFLRSPETHLDAFRFREERLLGSVARRLKRRLDEGMDSFQAMNECQDHLVSLARAQVERGILECFHDGVARAPLPGLSEVLGNLAELWALWRLEEDRGWFLETGYMEGTQSRAVRAQVNRVCGEIREQAIHLVEAFGIPEELLGAAGGSAGTREA
jgi:acyl-CoA oxidase